VLSWIPCTILEVDAKGDKIEAIDAAKAAIELVGNANTKINYLRRTKIISQMNKALLCLIEDDKNFVNAAPCLFGPAFAQKSKELVDQVKAMRSHLSSHKESSSSFIQSVPPPTAGGYQYGQKSRGG